jgi:hypothetical protein
MILQCSSAQDMQPSRRHSLATKGQAFLEEDIIFAHIF